MIRYFICDLDGTLIRNRQVSEEDKQAIATFISNGGQFIIATGRADFEIELFAQQEGIGPVSHRISCNGAHIHSESGECLFEKRLSVEANQFMQQQLQLLTEQLTTIEANDGEMVYYHGNKDVHDRYKDGHVFEQSDVVAQFGETIFPIKYFIQGSEQAITQLVEQINVIMPGEFELFNDGHEINIGPVAISKGTAVAKFLAHMQITPNEIAVIGDAANDVSMFEQTPYSFTFHHAAPKIQAKADYVVESVAEAVAAIAKINETK